MYFFPSIKRIAERTVSRSSGVRMPRTFVQVVVKQQLSGSSRCGKCRREEVNSRIGSSHFGDSDVDIVTIIATQIQHGGGDVNSNPRRPFFHDRKLDAPGEVERGRSTYAPTKLQVPITKHSIYEKNETARKNIKPRAQSARGLAIKAIETEGSDMMSICVAYSIRLLRFTFERISLLIFVPDYF